MAEDVQYSFSLREVARALFKQEAITEGIWALVVEFRFGAFTGGPDENNVFPNAAVGVTKLGLAKADTPGPLRFDAGELNPVEQKPPGSRGRSASKTRKKTS